MTATRDKRQRGFTLIEVLVVIIILGVLAAVAIPAYLHQRQRAVYASMLSDAKSLAITYEGGIGLSGPGPWGATGNRIPGCADVFTTNPDGAAWTVAGWLNGRTDSFTGLNCTSPVTSWRATKGNAIRHLDVRPHGYCLVISRAPGASPGTYPEAIYASTAGGFLPQGKSCADWVIQYGA